MTLSTRAPGTPAGASPWHLSALLCTCWKVGLSWMSSEVARTFASLASVKSLGRAIKLPARSCRYSALRSRISRPSFPIGLTRWDKIVQGFADVQAN